MTIGSKIKKRREELGMSQEELAIKVGYKSRSTINKIEKGINDITQTKIVEFAKALDTTPSYLMGWSDLEFEVENRPDALIENYEDNARYILEHEDKELLKVYKDLISDENLVLLVKKASKLSPQEVVQLLKIVNTFDVNDDNDPIDK